MPLPFTVRRTDPDAAAFCARSGASDRAAVSAFVRGVKDLGLWESMVCWPLRSEQNAGTGTTAYSLGGLGTFNGTLTNGPTWGADGLTNSATGRIATSYFSPTGSQAHIFVGNSGAGGGERAYGNTITINGSDWVGFVFRDNGFFFGDGALRSVDRDFTSAGNFKMAAALANRPADAYTYLNTTQGSITVGNAMLASNLSMTIMSAGAGQYFVGTAAFYATIVTALTPEQYISFYNLYRATLGTGLGLP
jgi:hypothetical protein